MEDDVGARGPRAHRVAILEVAADRLRAEPGHLLRRTVRTGERTHPPTVADQALDQPAADEAGTTGDECGAAVIAHQGVSLPVARRPA